MTTSRYTLPVMDTLSAAWDKVYGAKGTLWAAFGIAILFAFIFGFVAELFSNVSQILSAIINLIGQFVSTLLQMGMLYIAIQRAKDRPIEWKQVFYAFDVRIAAQIIGVYVIQFLIYLPVAILFIAIPMMIFGPGMLETAQSGMSASAFFLFSWFLIGILVSIYLSIKMLLSIGFVLDKNLNCWSAIKASFAATEGNIFPLIGFIIMQIGCLLAGVLLIGIGLIWALPLIIIMFGMAYARLSGAAR